MKTNETMTTKAKSKFPLGIKIASILACVSLLSVGFASWLVLRPVEAETQLGSFTAYTVSEKGVDVTISEVESDNANIVFGKSAEEVTESWLVATEVANEDLSATFKIDFEATSGYNIDDVVSTLRVEFDPGATVSAVDAKWLAAPTVKWGSSATVSAMTNTVTKGSDGKYVAEITPATDEQEQTVYLNVTFAWGTATGGENPYKYFNSQDYSGESEIANGSAGNYTYGALASAMLEAISDLASAEGAKEFTITISAN